MSLIQKEKITINTNIITNTQNEDICPSYLDTQNPNYMIIDGLYVSSLIVTGYNTEMEGGFLDRLLSIDVDIELSIYHEKQNTYEIIRELTYSIGNTGAEMKEANKNQTDIDVMSSAYDDAKYIRKQLQIGGEDLYYISIYITTYAENIEEIEHNLQKIESIAMGIGLTARRATYRQEQVLKSNLPIMQNEKNIRELAKRNVLTSGLVSTYPFLSNEICDHDGVVLGINEINKSIVMVDRFDSEKYKNANMCVIGTSGSGKSYFVKMMIIRNRYLGINQYIIDPDREYLKLCESLGGALIKFGGTACINIMDIRESSLEEDVGYLQNKIGKLNIFFELLFNDITKEEKALLEEKIANCYEKKGITFDDASLYKESNGKMLNKKSFKNSHDMPLLEDVYNELKKDKKTKRLSIIMKPLINGSLKCLNNYTNIDVENKLVIADICDAPENELPIIMYALTEFFWDNIKKERWKKKILYFDEAWRLINSNSETANFVFKIFKTIRKYGGAATVITQDINDFFTLDAGKYGRGIINNSSIKCVFQLEENDLKILEDVINLCDEEKGRIQTLERGTCLMYVGTNQILAKIQASEKEHRIITTDRKDLEKHFEMGE